MKWLLAVLLAGQAQGKGIRVRTSRTLALEKAQGNPLLEEAALPPLTAVSAQDVRSAMETKLAAAGTALKTLEDTLAAALKKGTNVTYDQLGPKLEDIYELYGRPWSMFSHLRSVRDSPELRGVEKELRPKVVAFGQVLSQSQTLYRALVQLNTSTLTEAQRRVVEGELLGRQHSGVSLNETMAKVFNNVSKELTELSTEFSNNVVDARKRWNYTAFLKEEVAGLPARTVQSAAAAAKAAGFTNATAADGPWLLTLDPTVLGPVLLYAQNRSVREKIYRASAALASQEPFDNTAKVNRILELRQKMAGMLGYSDYLALSLASKMATKSALFKLLADVKAVARPAAEKDDLELKVFARSPEQRGQNPPLEELKQWDRAFYARNLEQSRYQFDGEKLREYFPYPAVLQGIFHLAQRLFNVTVKPVPEEQLKAARWEPSVEGYELTRGAASGFVLVDPYSRPSEKKGGAWMQPLVSRRLTAAGMRRPVAVVATNFPQPSSERPSLLSLREVSTLFHEFGHALQQVLTLQNESSISGVNGIEWDAVEVASQFMEYWAQLDRTTLFSFAKHFNTSEPLPEDLYKRVLESKNFRSGSSLLGQLYVTTVDLQLHQGYKIGEDPDAIAKGIAKDLLVDPPLPESHFLNSFSHIFAGGYAAGYYSYLWSRVVSADAFSAFDEPQVSWWWPLKMSGLSDEQHIKELGKRYADTVLAMGGGRNPSQVYTDFRGRSPTPDALLQYNGLKPALFGLAFSR